MGYHYIVLLKFYFFNNPFLSNQPSLLICFDLAIAKEPSGTSLVIVDPAAIYVLSLTLTGEIKFVLHPIKALLPIIVFCFFCPS